MSSDLEPAISDNDREARFGRSDPIAILLCTFNGARFLGAQLASYEAQDFSEWRLFASDDGSQDDTLALLQAFQKRHGPEKIHIRCGPRRGFVANFLSLICDPAVQGSFYALSDQDDVWNVDKLSRARRLLRRMSAEEPVVYCSRTRLIDEQEGEIGLSTVYRRAPHFRNALAQSLAGGNTMVVNEKLRELLMQAGPDVKIPSHDWWIYLATTAVGGKVLYDAVPTVSYRMHFRNVIGSHETLGFQLSRARRLWQGRFKNWTDMNVEALERIEHLMTDDNRRTFALFRRSRNRRMLPRVCGLIRSGIYRQSWFGDIGLLAAAIAGKI